MNEKTGDELDGVDEPSSRRFRPFKGQGCILADDMGLGKTLQSITILHTLLRAGFRRGEPAARKALIVCPTSLVGNWESEIGKWLKHKAPHTLTLGSIEPVEAMRRVGMFKSQNRTSGMVLILSYEMARKYIDELIVADPGLLICDEAHRLKVRARTAGERRGRRRARARGRAADGCEGGSARALAPRGRVRQPPRLAVCLAAPPAPLQNDKTATAIALDRLRTPRRVLLSGTPVQNDLDEFFAMVNFCNPAVLGDERRFGAHYARPILRGREPDATDAQVEKGEARGQALGNFCHHFILRRTNTILSKHLCAARGARGGGRLARRREPAWRASRRVVASRASPAARMRADVRPPARSSPPPLVRPRALCAACRLGRPSWCRSCACSSPSCSASSTATSSAPSSRATCSPRTTRRCPRSRCSRSCATTRCSSARPRPRRWRATRSASPTSRPTTAARATARASRRRASCSCCSGCCTRCAARPTTASSSSPTTPRCSTSSRRWRASLAGRLCGSTARPRRRSARSSSRSSTRSGARRTRYSSSCSRARRAAAASTSSAATGSSSSIRTGTRPTTSRRPRASGATARPSASTSTAC